MVSDTRLQMILTAARLFQRDGYHATSWRSLVEEAGTPWGSIHHHFPGGKDELGVAAIQLGSEGVLALIDHCFSEHADPGRAVACWFELSGRLLVQTEYASGCPIATVALETAASPGPLQNETRLAFASWQKRLASHLRRAGLSRARAADSALAVLALLEGGLVIARTRQSVTPMRVASRHARAIVDAAVADSEPVLA
ncbi:MAG: TetR/AcrR family transcriptional regulator [Solirubrobacteraceae bacterium]